MVLRCQLYTASEVDLRDHVIGRILSLHRHLPGQPGCGLWPNDGMAGRWATGKPVNCRVLNSGLWSLPLGRTEGMLYSSISPSSGYFRLVASYLTARGGYATFLEVFACDDNPGCFLLVAPPCEGMAVPVAWPSGTFKRPMLRCSSAL